MEYDIEYFRNISEDEDISEMSDHFVHALQSLTETEGTVGSEFELNAMEKTLHLSTLRDEISDNISSKIDDPKEQLLIALLYKVCCTMEAPRMAFVRFSLLLHRHGLIRDLRFLTDTDSDATDECYECNLEAEEEEEEEEVKENRNENESESELPLIRLISFNERSSASPFIPLTAVKSTSQPAAAVSTPSPNAMNSTPITSRYLRDFDELELIGFGAFGTVHRARHKLDDARRRPI